LGVQAERAKMAVIVKPRAPTASAAVNDRSYQPELSGIRQFADAFGIWI